ncbi:MAG: hypothetical protein O7D91_05190 [Planctomycetota bacterium]|nr:hypothetical protein [Planctomycetota bacterium]
MARDDLRELLDTDKVRMEKLGIRMASDVEDKILNHPEYGCPVAYQRKAVRNASAKLLFEAGGARLEILVPFYYDPGPTINWQILSII